MAATYPVQGALSFAKRAANYGKVVSIKPPEITRDAIDTTVLGSTWTTAVAKALVSGGEMEVVCNYDPADSEQTAALTYISNSLSCASTAFSLVLGSTVAAGTGGTTLSFSGVITKFNLGEATNAGLIKLTVGVKVDGAVTVT